MKIRKLLLMQFCVVVCYFLPLRPSYLPQHSVFKHPQHMFFPEYDSPRFTPIQSKGKIVVLFI